MLVDAESAPERPGATRIANASTGLMLVQLRAVDAEMIGTTRSRVNFFMNKFRKLGYIRYDGEIHVDSSLMSVVLHE